MTHILITDVQYRKGFDIVSIVKSEFPDLHLILGTTASSPFCKLCFGKCDVVKLRTEDGYETFKCDFSNLLGKYSNDDIIYLPVEENTTDSVVEYIKEYHPQNLRYLLPDLDIYRMFRNKGSLNTYCLNEGFNAPKCYDISELRTANYPLILKPVIGSGSHGIIRLFSFNEIDNEIRNTLNQKEYVIQELIPNGKDVHGAFFLCHNGRTIGAYTHKRIRTSPAVGGVTVLSKMSYEKELIEQGSALLEKVKWNGLVMLEYLWDDRTNCYKVIEANPRMWGSIMLSEYGGAYLLSNYIRTCLNEPLKETCINTEKYIRWFFPMDIMNLIKNRFRMSGFWNMKNTCFINWSYARFDRAILFTMFSVFDKNNLLKLVKRI